TRATAQTPSAPPVPPVSMDVALRGAKLDEHSYAKNLKRLVRAARKAGEEKLWLDVTKEWGRQLERARPAERASAGEGAVFVQLIHNVPRPDRTLDRTLDRILEGTSESASQAALPGPGAAVDAVDGNVEDAGEEHRATQ